MANTEKYYPWLLLAVSLILFIPFLGHNHLFDWDEINFAESAREMIVTGDYLRVRINYQPFWEKPPLFFWLQVISMKVFGVNEFAARFPNAFFGVITVLTLYFIGRKGQSRQFGFVWSMLYAGSLLPHLYFRSGIIDPVFNYFIFLSVYFLYLSLKDNQDAIRNTVLAGTATGLAILTKGPVGLLLVLLTFLVVALLRRLDASMFPWKRILIFALTVFLVSSIWFGYETVQNGAWYLVEFIQYQVALFRQPVAGHQQPWYYHFVVVFIGCFPISVFALDDIVHRKSRNSSHSMEQWMRVLFWVVLILFTIVTTKIVHYSSMTYLPLSYLAARRVAKAIEGERLKKYLRVAYVILGVFWGLIFTFIPLVLSNKEMLLKSVKGKFAVASLHVPLDLIGWELFIGLLFLVGIFYAFTLMNRNRWKAFLWVQIIVMGLSLSLFSRMVLPEIEKISQGPAIEFFEQYANEDVYLMSEGHKSYAPYFYGRIKPFTLDQASDKKWLLTGEIDKPVYIAVKINKVGRMQQYKDITMLYQKGGFVFFERLPSSN